MGATSAVFLPPEINAEAFASPTLHALTSLIQVEPVVLREAADLGTNNSARDYLRFHSRSQPSANLNTDDDDEHYEIGKKNGHCYYYILSWIHLQMTI